MLKALGFVTFMLILLAVFSLNVVIMVVLPSVGTIIFIAFVLGFCILGGMGKDDAPPDKPGKGS